MKMLPPTVRATQRRPGRPALVEGEHSTTVTVRVSDPDYDKLCAEAKRCRMSVPRLIRLAALQRVESPPSDK